MTIMRPLHTLFGLRGLFTVYKVVNYVQYMAVAALLLLFTAQYSTWDRQAALTAYVLPSLIVAGVLWYFIRKITQTLYFNRLLKKHERLSEQQEQQALLRSTPQPEWRAHNNSVVLHQYREGLNTIRQLGLQQGDFWNVYDVVVAHKQRGKWGEYVVRQSAHTIFEAKLQRVVPNVVFDNRRAHGRQFRSDYIASQKLSFEGNFDQFFDSYAPQHYRIDTLSFISPEVLHAMVDFSVPCDVEIVDDRLIVFAPLVPPSELEGFRQQCLNLHANFNDNLDTYRDDRLTGIDRQQSTTPFARQLLRNPFRSWLFLLVTGLILAGLVVASFVQSEPQIFWNELTLYVAVPFIAGLVDVARIWHHNKQEIHRFQRLLSFSAAKDPRKAKQA